MAKFIHSQYTKKKKRKGVDKAKLWQIFDEAINDEKETSLECVYNKCDLGNKTNCDNCGYMLCYSDKKFLVCSNGKCGKMFNDILDESAEWRYYGADDAVNIINNKESRVEMINEGKKIAIFFLKEITKQCE